MVDERLGVCSWSLQADNPAQLVERVRAAGLSRVQLALSPVVEAAGAWGDVARVLSDAGIAIASGMLSTVGEDYTSIESIHRTGGIVPDETWPASRELGLKVIDKAGELGLPLVTFHAGFIPDDAAHPTYAKVRDRLRELADHAATHNVALGLETGQEAAATLDAFLADLDCDNVGVNFDPANMLLYGSGDPVDAVTLLLPRLKQVHIKDAVPSGEAGVWGDEVPAGEGSVDWSAFAAALSGYAGDFMIEREAGENRVADIATARALALKIFQ